MALGLTLAASVNPDPGGFGLFGSDKIAHFITWCSLTFLFLLPGSARPGRIRDHVAIRCLVTIQALTAISLGVELAQSLVPTRSADPADALANVGGAIAGACIWALLLLAADPVARARLAARLTPRP